MKIRSLMTCLLIVSIVAMVAMAATAEELKQKSIEHLEAAKVKQKALKTKVYEGTFDEILVLRVADVNDVNMEICAAKTAAEQALQMQQTAEPAQQFVKKVIADKTEEERYLQKHLNGTFLQAVEEVIADPNAWIDPNNPETPEELQARVAEFQAACLEIVQLTGGI